MAQRYNFFVESKNLPPGISGEPLLERSGKDVKWKSAYVDDFKTSWFEEKEHHDKINNITYNGCAFILYEGTIFYLLRQEC